MRRTDEHSQRTVVVIDDDDAARLSIAQMLKLRGYKVESFSSAQTTLTWPGLIDAACVVCDVKMPGVDGEEFLAEVGHRELEAMVIMITGHGDVAMAVRCLKAGAYLSYLERRGWATYHYPFNRGRPTYSLKLKGRILLVREAERRGVELDLAALH